MNFKWGNLPRTLWVVDYPLAERIYYSLVAGFNVIDTKTRQGSIRIYMDELRQEAETYFLDFMPFDDRKDMMQSWFGDMDIDHIDGFRAVSKSELSFFAKIDDYDASVAYVRIIVDEDERNDIYVSMVVNRWHDDVTSLEGEEMRLNPEKDSAVFIKNFVGSYPNYFFEVPKKEIRNFLEILRDYDGTKRSILELSKFGINRASSKFWDTYDRFQNRFLQSDPMNAGLFDLNRYYHKAYSLN